METLTNAINVQVDSHSKKLANVIHYEVTNPKPSKELLESLQEIEDYKNGKVQLPSFNSTKELFNYLDN